MTVTSTCIITYCSCTVHAHVHCIVVYAHLAYMYVHVHTCTCMWIVTRNVQMYMYCCKVLLRIKLLEKLHVHVQRVCDEKGLRPPYTRQHCGWQQLPGV